MLLEQGLGLKLACALAHPRWPIAQSTLALSVGCVLWQYHASVPRASWSQGGQNYPAQPQCRTLISKGLR